MSSSVPRGPHRQTITETAGPVPGIPGSDATSQLGCRDGNRNLGIAAFRVDGNEEAGNKKKSKRMNSILNTREQPQIKFERGQNK